MTKLIIILSLTLQGSAQTLSPEENKAATNLLTLIQRDPTGRMLEEVEGWMRTDKVKIVFTNDVDTMETGEYGEGIAIFVNTNYLTRQALRNPEEDQWRKSLQLRHEFVHVRKHLDGTHPVLRKKELEAMTSRQIAERIWNAELDALTQEWESSKAFHMTHLIPQICKYLNNAEESVAIKKGLYELLTERAKQKGIEHLVQFWEELADADAKELP